MNTPVDEIIAIANRSDRPLGEVIRHHFLEAVLARVSVISRPDFVLRGSMLTRLLAAPFPRPAADIDFLGTFPHSVPDTADRFLPHLQVGAADGVAFDLSRCSARGIWEQSAFPGVRLTLKANVFGEAMTTTVDIGFRDPLVPPPNRFEYPRLAGPNVAVWLVHPATLIGWKLHGLAEWGPLRWRPKDVWDLWLLTRHLPPIVDLVAAIRVAFTSRGYQPTDAHQTITDARWSTFAAQGRWADYCRSQPEVPVPPEIAPVVATVAARLAPALALLSDTRGRED